MEFRGTSFETYALQEFLRVQLLFDESFKYVKVSEIKGVSASPPQINVTSKGLFHRSSPLMKYLSETISQISEFNLLPLDSNFKNIVVRFHSVNINQFKNFTPFSLLESFQSFLTSQIHLEKSSADYYVQSIQLIDLALCVKSSSSERASLLDLRNTLLNCTFLQLPTISDQKFKNAISKSFNVTHQDIDNHVQQLQSLVHKSDVVDFLSNSPTVLSNAYKITDFENEKYYQNWILKSKNLESDLCSFFTDSFGNNNNHNHNHNHNQKFMPNQLNDIVKLLIAISLDSTSLFFQGLIKCMQIWQINPFTIQFIYIQTSLDMSEQINPELVEKAFNLSYLAMPFQVQFLEWPLEEKKNFLRLGMKIYNDSKDLIKPFFGAFFIDQKAFTTVLSFLKLLKLDLKNIKKEITFELSKSIEKLLDSHTKKANLEGNLNLDNVVRYLTFVSRDINLLSNWKFDNKDLNLSFQIFETGSKIIMTPTLEILKEFINQVKSNHFNLVNSKNKDNKINFGTFIDLVNNLKDRTNFKYDFQNEIYKDFYKLVESWNEEILTKTKVIIANDNLLNRLEGCSYSSGIQNLILLFQSYIKLLESFKWRNPDQSSQLHILLFKNIINSINFYHDTMMKKMNEVSTTKNSKTIDSFVCLNNIYKLYDFILSLEKNDDVLKLSEYLVNSENNKINMKHKYISVTIKDGENIEDFRGHPLSLKVKLSGLVNAETRAIMKDHNPDWIEEFNIIISTNEKIGNIKIDLIDVESNNSYKSVNYKVNLASETIFKQQTEKILLKPKSGSLNINVNVEFEKNDPLFYIVNCKNEINNSIKRSINLLIEGYLLDFKNIFTRSYLDQSIIDNPIRSENNYTKLQDPLMDTLISDFQVKIIPTVYNNLETKLFDKLVVEFWVKILKIAENLLLPRISIIHYRVVDTSKNSSTPLTFDIHQTTREELIRVVEWCFKLRTMLNMPDLILQDDNLNDPFNDFNNIKQLFDSSNKKLQTEYYNNWSYLNRNMLNRFTRGVKFHRLEWSKHQRDKELILRVLLTKPGGLKYVKRVLQMENRYEKTIKTEAEVAYLQQFL